MAYSHSGGGSDPYEEDYAYYEGKKAKKPSRRYGDIITSVVIIAIILILILLVTNAGFREAVKNLFNPEVGGYREYPEWAEFEVERTITVSPYPPGSAMTYTVDIPTPEDIPNSTDPWLQDVRSVISSPDFTEEKFPNYEWMVWEGNGETSQRSFTIIYNMRTESAVWDFEPSDSGNIGDIPQWLVDKYGNKTIDEWKILPSHPQIVALSDQLTAGKLTVYDKIRSIFDYLNDNFEYETVRGAAPKYCNETLLDKSGDCDDQSVLFISIARAARIPSWLEFGALYNQQQKSWGGHAWIRVYIPYYYGGGHVFNIDVVNDQFLFRDAYRFSEWESDGNGSHLKDYYYSYGFNFKYQERYTTLSLKSSSDKIRIGEDGRPLGESIPGFEVIYAIPVLVFMAIIMRKKRRNL